MGLTRDLGARHPPWHLCSTHFRKKINQSNKTYMRCELLKLRSNFGSLKVPIFLLVQAFVKFFSIFFCFSNMNHILSTIKTSWNEMILTIAFECQCRFQIKVHTFTSKVHYYVVATYLLHLAPKHIFLF